MLCKSGLLVDWLWQPLRCKLPWGSAESVCTLADAPAGPSEPTEAGTAAAGAPEDDDVMIVPAGEVPARTPDKGKRKSQAEPEAAAKQAKLQNGAAGGSHVIELD